MKRKIKKLLTEKLATELKRRRVRAKLSQYKLAEVLGWPRSKVKRLEKAEVKTISMEDIRAWKGATSRTSNVQESASERGNPTPKKRSSSGGGVARGSSITNWFELVRKEERSGIFKNLRFFRVVSKRKVEGEKLLGRRAVFHGVDGHIHGVENDITQVPIQVGDEFVLALWSKGIGG